MHRLRNTLREHRHVFIVVTVLTLVMTFPTIVYVFRTDVFWLPTGNETDIFIELWDIWYNRLILTGQAERFDTDLIYYPDGVSLVFNPMFFLFNTVVNLFQLLMPLTNAYCLAFLLLVGITALAAYNYALWLFNEKWIGLLAAAIFALSPQVLGHTYWPKIAWIAPIPVVLYFAHRGILERRASLVVLAGALTGILGEIIIYNFICMIMSLAMVVLALAAKRWRDQRFRAYALVLVAAIALSCAWRVLPLLEQRETLATTLDYYWFEHKNDLMSFFVNLRHPILGSLGDALLQPPPGAQISLISYLGFVPITLIAIGLYDSDTRRKMLPWLGLLLVFVILHLGSTLNINGRAFEAIKLPKYFLDQMLPAIFLAFRRADHFMAGVCLPLAILACHGLCALRSRRRAFIQPKFVLLLVAALAFEYYIPIPADFGYPDLGRQYLREEPTFVDWLEAEEEENIRLIHLPLGRQNSKIYYFYQVLSGYPQTEGAISRVPDIAYDFIRGNHLLDAWHKQRAVLCDFSVEGDYLTGLAQLEAVGFSHIVYHPDLENAETISASFQYSDPAYQDEFVHVYRLEDLRSYCLDEIRRSMPFAEAFSGALEKTTALTEQQSPILIFPETPAEADLLLRYFRHVGPAEMNLVTVSLDSPEDLTIQTLQTETPGTTGYLEAQAAVWLLNDRLEINAAQPDAFQSWFTRRFHFCRPFTEDDRATIDLYLRADAPCSAVDQSSALDILYDGGVRLHNASYILDDDLLRFYLAWTNATANDYGFSLQFFHENGEKALQYDHVIYRQLLSTHEIDTSSLPVGDYSIQLIVYDFETQISQGGTISDSGQRFPRALEIGRIEVTP